MKKIISIILIISTLLFATSFLAYGKESEIETDCGNELESESESQANDVIEGQANAPISSAPSIALKPEDVLSYSCYYDVASNKINIKGTMNYDAFAIYRNSTLAIYEIPIGKSESDVINDKTLKPIAEAPISITFAFSFKASNIINRYSKYAIFIKTEEGEHILTTEAQYAEISQTIAEKTEKTDFKGISGNYSSHISGVAAETAIIPVYLDSIYTNSSSGYVYQIEEHRFFFDKSYIDELDKQVSSLSFFDTKVYLQILLRPGSIIKSYSVEGAKYVMPDVYDEETVILLHSIVDFLISRYTDSQKGVIDGVVIGKQWDNPLQYNAYKDVSFDEYVAVCGHYAAILSNSIHSVNSRLYTILSLSGDGFLRENGDLELISNGFSAKDFYEALMKYFDATSYSGTKCSVIIESNATPLEITANDIETGIDISKELDEKVFRVGNHAFLSDFFNEVSKKYVSSTKYYSILWTPDKGLKGNALCAAYCYAFYSLLLDSNVTNFIVEFSINAENKENIKDLEFILKNIDTKNSTEATKNILSFFDVESWSELFENSQIPVLPKKIYYNSPILDKKPNNIKGEFYYFDFSKAFLADNWHSGAGCSDVKINYSLYGRKALRTDFNISTGDFCDLIYIYSYPESIAYTPYIKFNVEIASENADSLYELKFVFKSKNAIFESNAIVKGNEIEDVILDFSQANEFSLLENVKISLRSLDNSPETATMWIYDIIGYSTEYTSDELSEFIEDERDKIKHDEESRSSNYWKPYLIVIGVLASTAILGFVFILIVQKNNRSRRKE